MKKLKNAAALLSAVAGLAHAQSNVAIYGIVDTGLYKSTVSGERVFGSNGPGTPSGTSNPTSINDKLRMDEKINSRIGFRGTEELGGGLKATFELEKRFKPFNGSSATALEFEGASNVGLAGDWGAVRMGRVNNLLDETTRTFDPFNEFGVAARLISRVARTRQSNTVRYDTPAVNGFSGGLSYELSAQDVAAPNSSNAGYGSLARYNNGPLAVAVAYDKRANSADSDQWSLAASYAFGPAKVSAIYDNATLKSTTAADIEERNWLLGLSYKIGSGTLNANLQRVKSEQSGSADTVDRRYGIGYTHDLTKRTSLYADASRTRGDRVRSTNAGNDAYSALSLGMTHRF